MQLSERAHWTLESPTVVIVDGDPAVREHLRLAVEEGGYRVFAEAGNGAEALATISAYQPDIVVLDEEISLVVWPHATKLIRAMAPGIRIVLCTNDIHWEAPITVDAVISKEDVAYLPLTLDRVTR